MPSGEGFLAPGQENKVCVLQKAIYGLKQASRSWNLKITKVLLEAGYKKSTLELCSFLKMVGLEIIIIALYVGFIILPNNTNGKENLKNWKSVLRLKIFSNSLHESKIVIDQ